MIPRNSYGQPLVDETAKYDRERADFDRALYGGQRPGAHPAIPWFLATGVVLGLLILLAWVTS